MGSLYTCVLACLTGIAGLMAPGQETAAEGDSRLAWWREARFGMFIHWGPVSLMGTEIGWSRGGERRGYGGPGDEVPVEVYDNLYRRFNPREFDAKKWVKIARAAGMKYIVFTSRHHDGFSEFDTQADDYKITNPLNPFRRDVVKELADACRAEKVRFGVYYSQPNWRNPDAFTERHDRYLAYLRTQLRELSTNYGKLDILWFDGLGKSAKDYDGEALIKMVRALQPAILINDRMGLPEDFDTPEQTIGTFQTGRPWESCITICRQWAYRPNDEMKSLAQCVETLARCAGGDGNLLLNVGPMPDGRIEPRQVARLQEIGAWLRTNGDSIYGTRGGPWKPTAELCSTRRGSTVYVHVLRQEGDEVRLPAIGRRVLSGSLLGGGKVSVRQTGEGIVIGVPKRRGEAHLVVKLVLDGSAMDLPAK